MKAVYITGCAVLLLSAVTFFALVYCSEEIKSIERELKLKRQEEAALKALAAETEDVKTKSKKKSKRGC